MRSQGSKNPGTDPRPAEMSRILGLTGFYMEVVRVIRVVTRVVRVSRVLGFFRAITVIRVGRLFPWWLVIRSNIVIKIITIIPIIITLTSSSVPVI